MQMIVKEDIFNSVASGFRGTAVKPNPTNPGRDILCQNRQGVGLHRIQKIRRIWTKTYWEKNQCRIAQ